MAKQRGRPRGSKNRTTHAAETVGSALGSVMAKVDAWMAQREEIARELRTVADRIMGGENPFSRRITTPSMVKDAMAETNAARMRGERPGKRKRRKMSAEARAKISAAAKARWAKAKRGVKKAGGRGSEVDNG